MNGPCQLAHPSSDHTCGDCFGRSYDERQSLQAECKRLKAELEACNEEIASCRSEANGLINFWKAKAEKLAEVLRNFSKMTNEFTGDREGNFRISHMGNVIKKSQEAIAEFEKGV